MSTAPDRRTHARAVAPGSPFARSRPGVAALAALTVSAAVAACGGGFDAPDPSAIERAYVEEVLTTLASDDMRGRSAFSEDAMRAARYLAAEYEAAGLSPMPGADGFLQTFTVRSVATGEASVTLGGTDLAADRFVVRSSQPSLAWSTGQVPVVVVGADAPPQAVQQAVVGALQGDADALVFVHPDHAAVFGQLRGFLARPLRVLASTPGPSVAVALADAAADASFEVRATATTTEETLANVAGMLPGVRTDEYVLFSAHYDHVGVRSGVQGDSIANGANDNASGTAAVTALARYYADRGTPERTLLFAAFTAEEAGGYGSRYYSQQLDPDQIVAMFNIEMIGKPAVEGPNTAWITGFDRSSFGPLLQEAVAGTEYEFYPDPYPDQNLFYRSDNATLARLGVPAHSISTTPIDVDPDYHQVTDHVETLDLDHLTNTVRAIAMGAETMVAGEATPTRVDPATVN
ncbi:MAG: M20/M25/M40 family metallo-hydrolase [Longimicrobiales bacterium]